MSDPLKRLRELLGAAFRTPWTYENWEINCPQIGEGTECGYEHNLTTVLSPTEYPDGQVAAVNALPALLDELEAARHLLATLDDADVLVSVVNNHHRGDDINAVVESYEHTVEATDAALARLGEA